MEEARTLAHRRNPALLQITNDRRAADAAVRASWGSFLPSVDASLTGQYQQAGRQFFSGTALGASSDVLQSNYRIGVTEQLSYATFVMPRLQRANREAVDADIAGAEAGLRARVTQQYLTVLQAEANANLQDTLVASAEAQVILARAREIVGAATVLDVRRAEVSLGQAEVARLRARNQVRIEKIRLFQDMGVEPQPEARLTTEFPITPLNATLEELLALARRQNPALEAGRQRARVADLSLTARRAEYTPSLTVSTGWGGYTYEYRNSDFLVAQAQANLVARQEQCVALEQRFASSGLPNSLAQCGTIGTLTDLEAAALRKENNQFPFNFTSNPRSVVATISLPIFDGFAREQRIQESSALRDDARHAVRARELALVSEVTGAYLTLHTALRTVELQERNTSKARDEMRLAQDRYRIGLSSFLDLVDARAAFERAESDRINAIYEYHKAFAALESAVGATFR